MCAETKSPHTTARRCRGDSPLGATLPRRGLLLFVFLLTAHGSLLTAFPQEVQTLDLATRDIHPLAVRLGNAAVIQLPVEPVATHVGDPTMWLVEKTERLVSIKPIQTGARDTNLALVTRQGTLSFSVHLAGENEPFTPMIRVTRILDDSKPLPPVSSSLPESLAATVIREIRIAQNYSALKQAGAPEIREVEFFFQMFIRATKSHACTLLQSFRFRDTHHLVLHFLMENRGDEPLTFDPRRTLVRVGETFFAPLAVSLGQNPLPAKGMSENFLLLDGSTGLSPRQAFEILLPANPSDTEAHPACAVGHEACGATESPP